MTLQTYYVTRPQETNMNHIRFSKLLYVLLLFVLVACQAQATSTTVPPTAALTAVLPTAAPTAVPPTAAPTVAPAQGQTTFSSKTFKLPMTLTYGSDWRVDEYPDQVYLKNNLRTDGWELAFNLVTHAKIADPNSAATIPWPQDFVAYLRSNPNIEAGEPKAVTVAGFNGIQIDAHAKYTGDKRTFIDLSASDWLYLDMEEMWRFILLDDVNGERLLITMIVNPPVDELPMFADVAQKVMDTVVFSKPTTAQGLTTFSSKIYKLHMSVSFGPDWHILDDFTDLVTVANTQKDWELGFNIVTNAKLADPISGDQIPFPEDFVAWIKSNPDVKADAPVEVMVAGFKGLQVDATVMSPSKKTFLYLSGTNWNMLPSEVWRFTLLDNVNGERVLITIVAPPAQIKDFIQQAQSILDSVVFSK